MRFLNGLVRLVALVGLASCSNTGSQPVAPEPPPVIPVVANPTGDCPAPNNGATRDTSPGDTRWLPDCKAPLRREYYRVFAKSESRAWISPQHTAFGNTARLCAAEPAGSPLRVILDRYAWCTATPKVDERNAMTAADALALAHGLHEHLRFVAAGGGVQPYPYADDALAVCEQNPELAKGALAQMCAWEAEHERARTTTGEISLMGRFPPEAEGPPFAAAMNKLYGIAAE